MARIGVFLCHCGTNIAGTVNIPEVMEAARKMPQVVFVDDNKYSCSDPGQASIRKAIVENQLNRVVIGCCSPRMHENTFREVLASAGLNPYLLEIANLREQCSWVHSNDKNRATRKAIELIQMAVAKVARHEALFPKQVGITKQVLVIGGGIAGIQAALDIANSRYKVVLVEREPSIGGHMAQLDKTFPTLDCSACILTPKMTVVGSHPFIELMTYSEVENISGYVGNFKVKIRKKARYVDEDKCTGCGLCQEKCPWKVKSEFDVSLGKRKAIYTPFPQAVPNVPVIDKEHCAYFLKGTCRACEKFCEAKAINFEQVDQLIEIEAGAVILATGYDTFDPSGISQYGYGRYDNVITALQFERMCSPSGPTSGKLLLKDGREPQNVAIIHCVGSRDKNYHEYCSQVCCMYALKYSYLIKEKTNAEAYQMYIDMRCVGKGFEEFYARLSEEGVKFLRGKVAKVTDRALTEEEEGRLTVCVEDSLLGGMMRVPVDMVILCTALEPRIDAEKVARLFNISLSQDGFFLERHPKLDPVATMSDGIFIIGCCQGPKDIPETVAQASAAAAKVAALFSQDTLIADPMVAMIDPMRCGGCLLCVQVCPFKAIETQLTREGRTIAVVNESLCKGCGLCVGACRFGAANLRGFNQQQLLAEITALW